MLRVKQCSNQNIQILTSMPEARDQSILHNDPKSIISFGNSAFLEHLVLFGFEGQKLGTFLENRVHLKSIKVIKICQQ